MHPRSKSLQPITDQQSAVDMTAAENTGVPSGCRDAECHDAHQIPDEGQRRH